MPDFFAFEGSLRNGSFVAAGDVDGDGTPDQVARQPRAAVRD
jgi:hypothetical protein